MKHSTEMATVLGLVAVGAAIFLAGIRWGLPSQTVDPFLFGDHKVWSGSEILALAGSADQDKDRASDVSAKPLMHRDRAIEVNATDQDRARIVRRYRLMSFQPDEFTTFAAFSQMKPSKLDLDPRMYKYGGLWVYPIGAMLKVASVVGIVQLKSDAAFYLDHPEAFGRFYLVARGYSVAWGLIGVVAVFLLVRRISGSSAAAATGALCFMLMPVVVNAAHEAKPHLAGTVLMLLAVLAGAKFVESGRRRAAVAAALLCGSAIGMVPSAAPVLFVLPAMAVLRRVVNVGASRNPIFQLLMRETIPFMLVALIIYILTNPYVAINLLLHRALLFSNLGNSSAFYHAGLTAPSISRAMILIAAGTSVVLAMAGGISAVLLVGRASRVRLTESQEIRRRATGLLLAIATLPVAGAFLLFSASQPADYARFALPFDVFLAIEAVVAIATFVRLPAIRFAAWSILVLTTSAAGWSVLTGFIRDASGPTTRMQAALEIQNSLRQGKQTLASREEPAPWSLPPVDLFRWRVIVPPRGWPEDQAFPDANLTVGPSGFSSVATSFHLLSSADISWANKTFAIQTVDGRRSPGSH